MPQTNGSDIGRRLHGLSAAGIAGVWPRRREDGRIRAIWVGCCCRGRHQTAAPRTEALQPAVLEVGMVGSVPPALAVAPRENVRRTSQGIIVSWPLGPGSRRSRPLWSMGHPALRFSCSDDELTSSRRATARQAGVGSRNEASAAQAILVNYRNPSP